MDCDIFFSTPKRDCIGCTQGLHLAGSSNSLCQKVIQLANLSPHVINRGLINHYFIISYYWQENLVFLTSLDIYLSQPDQSQT
jgi:hypothetical protein